MTKLHGEVGVDATVWLNRHLRSMPRLYHMLIPCAFFFWAEILSIQTPKKNGYWRRSTFDTTILPTRCIGSVVEKSGAGHWQL